MNANEIANLLDQATAVIKKQQAEIETLKAKYQQEFDYVEKKFSDEEINWYAKAYTDCKGKINTNDFAKAILKKAQEK